MAEVRELKPFILCPVCNCGTEANIEMETDTTYDEPILTTMESVYKAKMKIKLYHNCRCGERIRLC